jgi:hypothetical protein
VHPELAALYEREKGKGNRNRGTLAVRESSWHICSLLIATNETLI